MKISIEVKISSVFVEFSEIPNIVNCLKIKMCLSQDAGGCDLKLDKEEKDRLSMSVLSQAVAGSMSPLYVGQYYFEIDKLRALTMSVPQSMAGFEKIRLVGKGAYGAAVLYRKKDDDSLVILKEINMIDLSATERQLALNEVGCVVCERMGRILNVVS